VNSYRRVIGRVAARKPPFLGWLEGMAGRANCSKHIGDSLARKRYLFVLRNEDTAVSLTKRHSGTFLAGLNLPGADLLVTSL